MNLLGKQIITVTGRDDHRQNETEELLSFASSRTSSVVARQPCR